MDKKKLIIVDDNVIDQEQIFRKISQKFEILGFYEEVESLLAAIANKKVPIPDGILLDLSLPSSWGTLTLEKVNPLIKHCRIIIVSGNESEDIKQDVLRQGAVDFIKKKDLISADIAERIMSSFEKPWNKG